MAVSIISLSIFTVGDNPERLGVAVDDAVEEEHM